MSVLEVARSARRSATNPPVGNPEAPHILAGRLNTGWIMCNREVDPIKKARLEDHWIRLLHDYEDSHDRDH